MKTRRILATILTLVMIMTLIPMTISVSAATDPVVFTKELLPVTGGQPRKIKLEAYTTGSTISSSATVPADIILVLDQSGSMDDTIDGVTKLSIMKTAVSSFASEVAAFNTANNNSYRLAIVGFASESGYNDNTEILTAYGTQTITNTVYTPVSITSLDTDNTYYIADGDGYESISYYEAYSGIFVSYQAGWYTSGSFGTRGDYVNIQSTTVYERITTTSTAPVTTPGVAYADLTNDNYAAAFVDCTTANIASDGTIGKAINQLDGNGATRTDLGMEMAEEIFNNQPAGTYTNRKKIVVVITDGVPTTASAFSATVANDAVSAAKTMKDDGAHIFSMYLGTPSSDSANFLQALSSNYPEATAYDTLGTKVANSYYSAHTQGSAVTNVFHDIAFSITANSTLDEKSVVTDTISEYFRLPAVQGGVYDLEQISVYTVDKIAGAADQWSSEEKPFETATVTIEGGKTIKVTGFNFAYHCVTETPKDGSGGTDYGRKLVIYIPIVEDESADTFGGYLPTNNGAGIYQTADAAAPEITAVNEYDNVTLKYSLLDDECWKHIGTETSYTFFYNEANLNGILADMIPDTSRPDGVRNLGVTMEYALVDTALTADTADDTVIATLRVAQGAAVDVTNFANWTLTGNTEKVLTITPLTNHAEAMYRLDCVLTNANDSGITLAESSYLDVEIVNENVHLVGGVIDDGGTLTVEPAMVGGSVQGTKIGNTYREEVTQGDDTAKMIFSANTGYEISKILHITSSGHDHPLDTTTTLFDKELGTDLITAGNPDEVGFFTGDIYTYQAINVQSGQAIEVYTRPVVYTLTTSHDTGSIIMDGTTYPYHASEQLEVFFKAHEGYSISSVEIDGVLYNASQMIANPAIFNLETDGAGILSGDVHLSKTQNHTVSVTSVKRTYNITYKYYQQNGGTFDELTSEEENIGGVEFGTLIPAPTAPTPIVGHTLKSWFDTYNGSEFTDLVDIATMTMPARDIILYAFWEKNPDVGVDLGTITKNIKDYEDNVASCGVVKNFTFKAVFDEHEVGEATLTLGIGDSTGSVAISATLTDAQNSRFTAGRPIYIYEVHNSSDLTLIYDDARYAVYHGAPLVIKNAATDTVAAGLEFNNKLAPYLVNYDLAGGNISGNTTIAPKVVAYDESGLLPIGVPIKAGSTFAGWKKESTPVNDTTTYESLAGGADVTAITIVAQWMPKNYTVHYDLADGTLDGNPTVADATVNWGDANLLPSGTLAKPSHTFAGWKKDTVDVDNTKTYAELAGADDVMEITLVAQWSYAGGGGGGGGGTTKYTLTYDSNGGTEYKKESYNRNTIVDIDKKPEKDGYVFEGWYEDEELTKYVDEVKMTKDITVYAKWVKDNGNAGNGYDTPGSLNGEDHFAYVVGYPDGTVRPDDNISRAEVTAIFFRLLKPDEVRDNNLTTENSFGDINDGDWHNTAISTMAKLGIVKGRYATKFVPDAFITRAEFATICARFDDSEFEVVDNFSDVQGHWAEHDIHEAAAHGWIRGYEDGTFKPDQFITRAEAMTMINRVLNRVPETADDLLKDMISWPDNSDKSAWYYLAVQEATNSHDYEMKNHIYEKWTALREGTDWKKYE